MTDPGQIHEQVERIRSATPDQVKNAVEAFVADLPQPAANKDITMTVRIPAALRARMDAVIAYAQAQGRSDVTLSWMTREAIEGFVEGVEERIPAVTQQ